MRQKQAYCSAIVVAAGSGRRMGTALPKQFLPLAGRPVLYYALAALEVCEQVDEIIVVTGKEMVSYCREHVTEAYGLSKVKQIVPGGDTRPESVLAGLAVCAGSRYVLVQDGARPFLSAEILSRGFACAERYGACAAAVPVKDTIKLADETGAVVKTPPRDRLWQIQTPQLFARDVLERAYAHCRASGQLSVVTDDAMAVELCGEVPVHLFTGSYDNIKLTTPEDLDAAEVYVQNHRG